MVKRRPPYVLIAVIVLFLGGGYLMNRSTHTAEDAADKPAAVTTPDATGPAGGKVDASALASSMKTAVGAGKTIPGGLDNGKFNKAHGKGAPTVPGSDPLVGKAPEPYKPKPSESGTSTQWWKSESNLKDKGTGG